MNDRFDDDPRDDPQGRPGGRGPGPTGDLDLSGRPSRSRALVITAGILIAAFFLVTTFTTIYTDRLWFRSLGYGDVFTKLFVTKAGLFAIFGLLMAIAVAINIYTAHRFRPFYRPGSPEDAGLERYRDAVLPVRAWLLLGISVVIGMFAGTAASGEWRTYLLWANRVPFGKKDAYFGKDIGFYVFELPWLHFLVNFVMAVLFISLLTAAVVHYLYGGIRLQTKHDRLTGAAQAQLSVLLGLFVLAKAADYWLDRFDMVNQGGALITGVTYTDDHAVLPAKNILFGIAIICAVLFFLNLWRRTWLLPSVGLALLAMSAILLGMIWPGLVQQFQVSPAEPDKERPYIEKNIDATRDAYDLQDVEVKPYEPATTGTGDLTDALLADTASVPLVDPQLVRDAFEQQQQVRSYYSVADVLDVDHYEINGIDRALVLGVRELDQTGIPQDGRNWSNLHTVYTHGNGIIASFANQRPAGDTSEGSDIEWAQGQEGSQNALETATGGFENRVYFGEQSPTYSIVGKLDGAEDVELNLGGASDSSDVTTYDGKGGVAVGSLFRKFLYAVKFGDPNLVLSGRVNENSQILYTREPLERVQKVAPWLTLDRDPYPAVVDGRILWVVDGYTTTDRYPLAQRESFTTMTDDALNQDTGVALLPTDEINYMRNAVKATVDAYDGTVTLYAWDESDPMLTAWSNAFPDTVQPRASIPDALASHLRYPKDLFKVQRYQFASYHVTDATDFYQKQDRWAVPEDPQVNNRYQPPYRLFVQDSETGAEQFALTSVYVPNGKNNLASFVSVNSDATSPDYGKITVQQLPNENTPGPGSIANEMSSNSTVADTLQGLNLGNAKPDYGNLLTLPVAGGLMYVEPVYARKQLSEASYPILRYVVVSYGNEVAIGETLEEAIIKVVAGSSTEPPPDTGTTEPPPDTTPEPPEDNTKIPAKVRALLADAQIDFDKADQALDAKDIALWAELMEAGRAKVDEAVQLLNAKAATP